MMHPTCLLAAALVIGCSAAQAQQARGAFTVTINLTQADSAAATVAAEERRQFAEAVHLYRSGRWSAAYGRFMALADRGHARAARIALSMLRDGPQLYGTHWDAAPSQVSAWERAKVRVDPAPVLVLNE
jgi:hypothetical protein